jgi:3alpha(or 20beta)-hydroxysteroid dehydrogenase
MMFSIEGKVTVITGGTSGIGKATAQRFARGRAHVVLAARNDRDSVAQALGCPFVRTDVSVEEDVRNLMMVAAERFGRIDVLVQSAGIFSGSLPIDERSGGDMVATFAVNTLGSMLGIKHAARCMPRGSSIINIGSLAGVTGVPGYTDYAASKFALTGLTRGAALDLGPRGIRVNCICPGSVNTPMLWNAANGESEATLTRTLAPLGVLIEPDHVAAFVQFLAADDCPTISGQQLLLDGGATAGFSIAACEAIVGFASTNSAPLSA